MKKIIILNLLISTLYSQIIWGPDIRITVFDTSSDWSPRAVAWGDTIHLVFKRVHNAGEDIYYMRSIDRGETWSEPINLTINDPDDANSPWITCWENKVHVVYQEGPGGDSIMYIRSLDGGNTWENPRMLAKPGAHSLIEGKGDTLFVIFTLQTKLAFKKSYNGGNNWSPLIIIDTTTFPQRKRILAKNKFLHVVVEATKNWEIYYLRSPDKGETWEGPFVISKVDSIPSQKPTLSVSDSSIYIAWGDVATLFTDYIIERHSHDNGNTFSQYQNLTPLGRSRESEIYTNGEFVILVWKDNRINGGTDFDLFWRASFDGGNTWTEEKILSDTSTYIYIGFCATGYGDDIYVFWSDSNRDGLFFKKGIYVNVEEKYGLKERKEINILCSNILFLPQKIKIFVKNGIKYSLNLLDLQGRKILTLKEGIGKGEEEIILKEISLGSYFLILETKAKIFKRKILILKGG
ncbi:MAG: hypothetical protein ABIM29_04565 [candidate division WOR-3 bacterium]